MESRNRKQLRLPSFDYGEVGCYFVTLCTHHRQTLFHMEQPGAENGHHLLPNQILHKWIIESQTKYENITIDKYVIMPDHLHLIVTIKEQLPGGTLPDVMHFFKTMTTNEYIRFVKQRLLPAFDSKLWQKSYYDHVIRNQQDYQEIWEYIENNPAKWMLVHRQQP